MNRSLTTTELKKPHPSRLVGRVQSRMGWLNTNVWGIKIWEGYLGARSTSPTPVPAAQGSSARKISPHNFWLQKLAETEAVEEIARIQSSSY